MGLISFEDTTGTIQFPMRMKAISVPLRGDQVTFIAGKRTLVFVVTGVDWCAEYPDGELQPRVQIKPVYFSPPQSTGGV